MQTISCRPTSFCRALGSLPLPIMRYWIQWSSLGMKVDLCVPVGLCSFPYDPGMIGQQFSHPQDAGSWFEFAGLPYLRCHWQEDQLVVQNTKFSKAVIVDVMKNMNEKHMIQAWGDSWKWWWFYWDNLFLNWTHVYFVFKYILIFCIGYLCFSL